MKMSESIQASILIVDDDRANVLAMHTNVELVHYAMKHKLIE